MNQKILLLFSSTDGHTQKICYHIESLVKQEGAQVDSCNIKDCSAAMLAKVDCIVIGASVRYGKFHPDLSAFLTMHQQQLHQKKTAFFGVNLVARKPHKSLPETNPYVKKFLSNSVWKPDLVSVFAGHLNYPAYSLLDKRMIQLIMWLTKGPTDTSKTYDFTSWQHVDQFAQAVIKLSHNTDAKLTIG
jgi:menaquinone-dependent protoporphyrinogen oxidase